MQPRNDAHDLEKPSPDALIERAVSGFVTAVRASQSDVAQFSDLFCGHYEQCGLEARKRSANLLATSANLSTDVVTLIALDEASVSARFLRLSPLLTASRLDELASRMNLDQLRALARRPNLPASVASHLRQTGDADINKAINLRQIAKTSTPNKTSMSKPEFDDILHASQARDLTTLCETLSHKLSITSQSAFALVADKTSANLVIALKYLGMTLDDAWTIYQLLAPVVSRSEGMQAAFAETYDHYDHAGCAAAVKSWIVEDLADQVSKPVADNDRPDTATEQDLIDQAVDLLKVS